VSGRLALHHARGEIGANEVVEIDTGRHEFLIAPDDPLRGGFMLR
jgi:hypothetical protein